MNSDSNRGDTLKRQHKSWQQSLKYDQGPKLTWPAETLITTFDYTSHSLCMYTYIFGDRSGSNSRSRAEAAAIFVAADWQEQLGNSRIDSSLDSSSSIMIGSELAALVAIIARDPHSEFAPKRFWRHATKPPESVLYLNLNFIAVGAKLILALVLLSLPY